MRTYFQNGDKVNWNGKEGIIEQLAYRQSGYYNDGGMSFQAMISFSDGTYVWEDVSQLKENNTMDIKEKFVLAITPEPKKSFRKAGIIDGDNILTDEGERIFITWLLYNKFAEDFKKEVVDEMLKEKKDAE